jgi:hypothetical protein
MSDQKEDEEFVTRIGPVNVDWPQSIGYFGGIGLAVALDLIAPPLAIFVAAVPFLKLLKRPNAPRVERWLGALLQGIAKPVGGDADSAVTLVACDEEKARKEEEEEKKASSDEKEPRAPATVELN